MGGGRRGSLLGSSSWCHSADVHMLLRVYERHSAERRLKMSINRYVLVELSVLCVWPCNSVIVQSAACRHTTIRIGIAREQSPATLFR